MKTLEIPRKFLKTLKSIQTFRLFIIEKSTFGIHELDLQFYKISENKGKTL